MWVLLTAEHVVLGRKAFVRTPRGVLDPDSQLVEPLLREATLLASLAHPNVLALHELIRTDTELGVVIEHAEGSLLSARLSRGSLGVEEAARLVRDVLAALAHAHGRGVVHGALAPRHVVVSSDRARLLGFGLHAGPLPLDADETLDDPTAPEVRLGGTPTTESDVFAVGTLAFRVFSGEGAFDAPPDVPGRRAMSAAPRLLDEVVPGLPSRLSRLLARCLSERPEDRYGSAGEVLAEWDRLFGDGEQAPKVSRILGVAPESAPDEPVARSMWVTLGGLLFVLFALVLGLSLLHVRSPDGALVERPGALDLVPERAGFLRVLARPWARVYIDGVLVETTPFARPIPLGAGLHDVVLKHPAGPDVKRHVRIGEGETSVLEVEMPVPPPPPPPRPSASSPPKDP